MILSSKEKKTMSTGEKNISFKKTIKSSSITISVFIKCTRHAVSRFEGDISFLESDKSLLSKVLNCSVDDCFIY